ncbi:ras GEF [Fomitiporia mediterranea MF3/22]|uniref:ras GEF n=1 Tax=Fomitiporia mediterranea (strain MF3/22) TaxID=694068 RepID=UPI0004407C3B|nr:ras GEF [Fomitiporia mediterranea MF3/22]EJC98507.1 ras GEF [Fomitiporia mediterranea MF3/22]
MLPPTIDTSVGRVIYSSTSKSAGPSNIGTSPRGTRSRSLSTASTSSSISLVTPVPSSGNASSSSLELPHTTDSRDDSAAIPSASEQRKYYSDEEDEGISDVFVRALHDFVPQQQNATCLAFRAGEIIRVLNRDPSGWWDGEIDGRRGWFPSNYVSPISLADRPVPLSKKTHGRSMSDISFASRASTASPMHRPKYDSGSGDSLGPASHAHPLMVPLLHSLQLLQNTTLVRRTSHYQPAVACIIQCIRALLQSTDCLARGAPLLIRFPVIAQQRKRVLADLALLVTQSKKASSLEFQTDEERDPEEELMLRLAGQVFARVRRFLAVVVQCGVDLPERSFGNAIGTSSSETVYDNSVELYKDSENVQRQYGFQADDNLYLSEATPKSADIDPKQYTTRPSTDSNSTTQSHARSSRTTSAVSLHGYHGRQMSLSSSSSFSSFSSLDSPGTPPTPPFPEGPCTAMQVQQALRSIHDSLLSTIAAFIGHVHAHSRTAHASSTGHLFALVRQIVDVVCRLLTIVDAVMCVEAIPWMKRAALETAKENLYQVACALADAVREMATSMSIPPSEEEEERRHLLKVATDVLKAGSDCVSAIKTCLARPLNAPPYVIVLPPISESNTPSVESSERTLHEQDAALARFATETDDWKDDNDEEKRASVASGGTVLPQTLEELHEQVQVGYATTTRDFEFDNEDTTIQSLKRSSSDRRSPKLAYDEEEYPVAPLDMPGRDRQSFIAALNMDLSGTIEEETKEEEGRNSFEKDMPSPTSQAHSIAPPSSEEGQRGSVRTHKSLEDKLLNGELPSIPQTTDDEDSNIPLAWALSHDYAPQDVAYNSEGQLVGATLEALIEKMTTHDQIPDAGFSAVFFLTFRLFTTAYGLAEAVIARFNLAQPSGLSDADAASWSQQKLLPVRLRVQNLLKLWLEVHWRVGVDDEALPVLQSFVRGTMAEVFAGPAQRLDDLISTRSSMTEDSPISPLSERQRLNDRLRDAGIPLNPSIVPSSSSSETPRTVMTKALLVSLRAHNFDSIAVTDFDALELARQMTLVESRLYSAITAEEMIELGRPGAPPAVNIKAVTTLSTAITGWVSESILGEQDVKRRATLMKFFIKVADRCTSLNNFSTPRSILAALDSSTISRLHQTWSTLAQKSKLQLEVLRKLADHARNYHEYRTRLRNTNPPAVPFLGLYLTDLTFCREGNPSHRASPLEPNKKLLNFNKYHKLARIVQDMQRFQVSYNLKDVAEAQQYLHFCLDKTKDHGDLDDLYRRSQLLEPKRAAEAPAASELKPSIFSWGNRSQTASQPTIA